MTNATPLPASALKPQSAEPVLAPVSIGELIDKVTILEIKAQKIADADKRAAVMKELNFLNAVDLGAAARGSEVLALKEGLRQVNETLWTVEDDLRACEHASDFGPRFIELARSVYRTNDRRAELKRQINVLCGSALTEVKLHPTY